MLGADVIFLSDVQSNNGYVGGSHYIGPYALASELERNHVSTLVIDNFLRHPDFFNWFENYLDKNTKIVGISSTFLTPIKGSPNNKDTTSPYRSPLRSEGNEVLRERLPLG